jgi:Mrp family chromosome partitioning ATPase
LSKIFDALRKAEQDRSGLPRKRGGTPRRIHTGDETERFLTGIDAAFKHSLLNLRNSIDSEMRAKDSRVVMFTSALPGEGKTTIVSFLARLLAAAESDRILLVDCAVANPELHELFGLSIEKGILDHLSGEATLEAVTRTVDAGFLDVITSGLRREADITQPLFNSERMSSFTRTVAERYDYVLIDTSAVLEAPETPIIGSYANGAVMVIRAGKTKREVIRRDMMTVEKLDGRFIGTVLNRKKYYIPEFIYRRI